MGNLIVITLYDGWSDSYKSLMVLCKNGIFARK